MKSEKKTYAVDCEKMQRNRDTGSKRLETCSKKKGNKMHIWFQCIGFYTVEEARPLEWFRGSHKQPYRSMS